MKKSPLPILMCAVLAFAASSCMSDREAAQAFASMAKQSQAEVNAILFIQQAATEFYRKQGKWPMSVDELRAYWRTVPDLSAFERVVFTPTEAGRLHVVFVRRAQTSHAWGIGPTSPGFDLDAPVPEEPNKASEPTPGLVTPRALE